MTEQKTKEKHPLWKIITWIVSGLIALGGLAWAINYIQDKQKRDDEIEHRLLSTPAMMNAVETHMGGVNEVANFEASLKLRQVGEKWVVAADTLVATYNFVYDVLDTYRLQNQALLRMVHNIDSLKIEDDKRIKRLEINLINVSNTFLAIQAEIKDINTNIKTLKAFEMHNGD